jgi:hypothetical protein
MCDEVAKVKNRNYQIKLSLQGKSDYLLSFTLSFGIMLDYDVRKAKRSKKK